MTERVVVIHHVEDYQRWRAAFDTAEPLRVAGGERSFEVLQSDDDPNLVVHIATWTSLADARRFFESADVIAIRSAAGVGAPDFHYLHSRE